MFIYNMARLDKHNDIDTEEANPENRLILAKILVKGIFV